MERYKPKRIFYVYALFRPDTGDVCYIGKGKGDRWRQSIDGTKSNKYLQRIVRKHGLLIPIKIRTNLTEPEAFAIEVALIAAIGRVKNGGPLANLSDGGEGPSGCTRTEEHKALLSKLKKGKKLSAELCAIYAVAQTGRVHSEESCLARSRKLKGRVFTPEWCEKISISASLRQHPDGYSEEHCNAIASGVSNYWERWRNDPKVRAEREEKKIANKLKKDK